MADMTGRFAWRAVALAAAGLAAVGLAACSSASSTSTSSPAASSGASTAGEIGISVPLLNTPFWVNYSSITSATIKSMGLHALATVNANNSEAQQVSDIQTMLTEGAKGVIMSPVDSGAVVSILNVLQSKKIPVVIVNDAPTGGHVAIVVQANNYLYGQDECMAMAQHVQSGEVVDIQGDQSSLGGRQRSQGFEDCMRQRAPKVGILRVPTKWDVPSVTSGLETLLGAHSDIKGIDMAASFALPPVMQVLKAKGLLFPRSSSKHIFLTSIDGVAIEYQAMRQGYEDAVIAQPVAQYAKVGVQDLVTAMNGQTFKLGPTDHNSVIIRDQQGNLEDQLAAQTITPANLASVYSG